MSFEIRKNYEWKDGRNNFKAWTDAPLRDICTCVAGLRDYLSWDTLEQTFSQFVQRCWKQNLCSCLRQIKWHTTLRNSGDHVQRWTTKSQRKRPPSIWRQTKRLAVRYLNTVMSRSDVRTCQSVERIGLLGSLTAVIINLTQSILVGERRCKFSPSASTFF